MHTRAFPASRRHYKNSEYGLTRSEKGTCG